MFGSTRKEPEEHDPAEALLREVGDQFRQARLARGEELEDVAEYLRIQPTYLRGLEQGDLSVIPGRAYAFGFLRSYAQHLGFDGDDLIAQIRSSVGSLTGGAPLHGRTPLSESRLPKVPILVISLAALAGIYAGWAYVEDRSRAEGELVAEVPDDLQERLSVIAPEGSGSQIARLETPASEAPGPEILLPEAAEPDTGSAIEPPEGGADAQTPTELPDAGAEPAAIAAPAERGADPVEDRPLSAPLQDTAPQIGAPEVGGPAASAPGPDASEGLAHDPGAEQTEPAAITTQPAPQVARAAVAALEQPAGESAEPASERSAADILAGLEPVAADAAAPVVYRAGDADSRVILRARSSSWVHVSSTNNDFLWVKTLQPGDAFVVPDRPDLMLWTGNAGGVEVVVDGAPLPPLGPDAGVVRDVSLQPRALLRRLLPSPAAGDTSGRP